MYKIDIGFARERTGYHMKCERVLYSLRGFVEIISSRNKFANILQVCVTATGCIL